MNPLAPGTVIQIGSERRGQIAMRLEAMSLENLDGCREWLGATDSSGYGKTSFGARVSVGAHRLAFAIWRVANGKMMPPDVHHQCEFRLCIHPEHLDGTGRSENLLAKTWKPNGDYVCKNGHVNPKLYVKGQRWPKCSVCHKAYQRAYDSRQRGKRRWHGSQAHRRF